MNQIFQPYLRQFVLVDILVYSITWEAHLQHLQQVFQILMTHQLYLKLSKCDIGVRQVEYLDHVITANGVAMDSKKMACLLNWHTLRSVKKFHGFFSLTGYYRRFIKGYGVIAKPLTDLLKKSTITWSPEAQTAFEVLKWAMVTVSVLALPNSNLLFIVESNASSESIKVVLS